MNKEKEIEEMNKVIEDMEATALLSATIVEGYCVYDYRDIAEPYYKAGYRKADEVRKETAKEILQDIKDICKTAQGYEYSFGNLLPVFAKVFGKYGVEVDE